MTSSGLFRFDWFPQVVWLAGVPWFSLWSHDLEAWDAEVATVRDLRE